MNEEILNSNVLARVLSTTVPGKAELRTACETLFRSSELLVNAITVSERLNNGVEGERTLLLAFIGYLADQYDLDLKLEVTSNLFTVRFARRDTTAMKVR